jgi:hypothetical protein
MQGQAACAMAQPDHVSKAECMYIRKILTGLVLASVLALLAACGGSQSSNSASGAASAQAESNALSKSNFATRLADAQKSKTSFAFSLTLHNKSEELTGQGAVSNADAADTMAMQMAMNTATAGDMNIIMLNETVYLQSSALTGSKYVSMALNDPLLEDAGLAASSDFSSVTKPAALAAAMVSFEDQGDGGVIDGVKTTKLHIVVDTTKAITGGLISSSDFQDTAQPDQVAYDLWVGVDDDLIRRVATDFGAVSMTMDISKWGEPVSIVAPSTSDTMSMSDMFGVS